MLAVCGKTVHNIVVALSKHPFLLAAYFSCVLAIGAPVTTSNGYGKLPVFFEPNTGQFDPQVRYIARTGGHIVFFTDREMVVPGGGKAIHLSFCRRDLVPRIESAGRQAGVTNYFRGNDPSKWHTNVPTYRQLRYVEIYPGVDLLFYGNGSDLEFDLAVRDGADPSAIRLAFSGADGLTLNQAGDLVVKAGATEFRLRKPAVYQDGGSKKAPVQSSYRVLSSTNEVQVNLGAYDRKQPLIIDPILSFSYSTYLGGTGFDQAQGIAVDSAGSAYITGFTTSTDFPLSAPLQSANKGAPGIFVTKLNPAGTALVYSTYLGGSGDDRAFGIALDGNGNAYIGGTTSSADFPTMNPMQAALAGGSDAFVTKLNAAGTALVYSTYLGGSGDDGGAGIAVDSTGQAVIAGSTVSANFPLMTAQQAMLHGSQSDAFVTKLNAAGSALVYSTYLGGSAADRATGVAIDSGGNAYVVGTAGSSDFPTIAHSISICDSVGNAFVVKLSGTGIAQYSTCVGGSGKDSGNAIAVDTSGDAYIAGQTYSLDFPVVNAFQGKLADKNLFLLPVGPDAFVAKLNPAGTALIYSTYLGGLSTDPGTRSILDPYPGGFDSAYGIAVDASGNAYVTGTTRSADFPTLNAIQQFAGGHIPRGLYPAYFGDVFVANFDPAGTLIYSTFVGGVQDDNGYAIAIDTQGNAYLAGGTSSTDFPIANAFQGANHALQQNCGFGCPANAFIAKLASSPGSTARASFSSAIPASITVTGQGCNPGTYILPQSLSWITGRACTVTTIATEIPTGARYQLSSWSDGSTSNPRTFTAPLSPVSYTFNFNTQYLLTTSVSLGGAGVITAAPSSADGYYNAGTAVMLSASANAGYAFRFFSGDLIGGTNPQTVTLSTPRTITANYVSIAPLPALNIGIFRLGFYWLLDIDGNRQFNSPPDRAFPFGGIPGDIPITGDWNGDGHTKVGVYRSSNGLFILDTNGNGVFDAGDAVYKFFTLDPTDIPVVGDWNGDGRSKVGLFRQGFLWILDTNGNGIFDSGVDQAFPFGGIPGDVPVVGDWTGSGTSKVGVVRFGYFWILDANGNGTFDGTGPGQDLAFPFGGIQGDVPVVGDWNGTGTSKVGVFRLGFFWVLDANGNHLFDGTGPGQDLAFPFGGILGDKPVVGRW